MKISFYEYKDYLECPKKYDYKVRKVPSPEPENKYFAIYGMTMEKFFQYYCNEWHASNITFTKETVEKYLEPLYKNILTYNTVDWGAPFVKLSSRNIFDFAVLDIMECLSTLLVFKGTKSESSFKITLKNNDRITGRVDFIHTTETGEVYLLDGKGTDTLGKNVDPEQLFMYALMYYFTRKKFPDKLGFLYYKLKHIDYLDFDVKTIDQFRKKLLLVMTAIKNDKQFVGKPSTKACKYCNYKSICDEYQQRRIKRQRKSSIEIGSGGEAIDLGF